MVGNPSTEAANVYDSEPRFALYKALIGRPLYDDLVAACDNVFHNVTPGAAGPRAACASALSPRRPPPAARRAQARPARRCTRRCATSCTRCPTRSGARPRRALGQLRCLGEHAPRPPPARAQGALQVPRPGRRRRPRPRLGRHAAATVTAGGGARRGRAHGAGPRRELGRAGLPRRARVYRPQARPRARPPRARPAGRPADRQPAEGRCARREVTRWLNSERVREALHAAPRRVTGDFEECSSRLDYRSTYGSMVPVHRQLLKQGAPRAGQPRPRPARPRSRALTGLRTEASPCALTGAWAGQACARSSTAAIATW